MINLSEVNSQTSIAGQQVYRYEYSCRCGWIDWEHARADRPDLESLRRQLPFPPIAGGLPLNQINWSRWPGSSQRTFRVRFSPVGFTISRVVEASIYDYGADRHRYMEIALALYLMGCGWAEQTQWLADVVAGWLINTGHSGYSFEDMTSNLLAFHQTIAGYSREQIREMCHVVPQTQAATLLRTMTEAQRGSTNRDPFQPVYWHTRPGLTNCCADCQGVPAQLPTEINRVRPASPNVWTNVY